MKKLKLPDVWFKLGTQIHQDFLYDYPDLLVGTGDIIRGFPFSENDRKELRDILEKTLSDKYVNSERNKFWKDTGAEYGVRTKDIEEFLRGLLKIVNKELGSKIDPSRLPL